ncbi:MAG: KpsF/GutQ family sugar-phosphate isomerase, partial [Pseudomonadota bacterium]|nr:KpsF/GutQ family sugar-phosphate isomerase [Pseudomonadota bacterium]
MIEKARSMLASYNTAMTELQALIDDSFEDAVETLASLESVLIITGLGKSGLVGQKAAATFSSTGTPSTFVHPVEALHGDLGIVQAGSVMLAISKGGGNEETIEFARQYQSVVNGPVITMTEPASRLEELADIALHIPALPEIDEWDLAPTTSTITSMALCDVLAICTQQRKDLTQDDFAQFHPSGTLGKRLLLNVGDLMTAGANLPIQDLDVSFADLVYEISSKGIGMVLLTERNGELFGVLTDGDIRRLMARNEPVT